MRPSFVSLVVALFSVGCTGGSGNGDTGDQADLCAGSDMASIEVGGPTGDPFVPFTDGEEVGTITPPQGGYGLAVRVHTEGLAAGEGEYVDLLLDLEHEGVNEGTFFTPGVPLLCQDPELGGLLTGVAAGFDPERYTSDTDLAPLDGQIIDIVVIVTDAEGHTATVRQPVTLRVGA